jgi:hypothetical protein
MSGTIAHMGFHTVDLPQQVSLNPDDDFYIYLNLSDGGQPYDRTIEGYEWWAGVKVQSISHPGESYYSNNGVWYDLYDYENTANFCIKGLAFVTLNQPPNPPIINGPHYGKMSIKEYVFTLDTVTDPEGDQIYCYWDWGDGNIIDWVGPFNSGETITSITCMD